MEDPVNQEATFYSLKNIFKYQVIQIQNFHETLIRNDSFIVDWYQVVRGESVVGIGRTFTQKWLDCRAFQLRGKS